MSKLTTIAAVVFMLTSFTLAVVTTKGGSVIKKEVPVTEQQPAVPSSSGPVQGTGTPPVQSSQPGMPLPAQPQSK
jgi:preprotein translocase subunit SecG